MLLWLAKYDETGRYTSALEPKERQEIDGSNQQIKAQHCLGICLLDLAMDVAVCARSAKRARLSYLHDGNVMATTSMTNSASQQQIDDSGNYYQQGRTFDRRREPPHPSLPRTYLQQQHQAQQHRPPGKARTHIPPRKTDGKTESAVTDVLPFCTTEPPLKQEQVIALSDVVGSVKELVVLALSAAAGEHGGIAKMDSALEPRTARNIVEFFSEEWEME
jgi:hypothetical protein